MDAHDSIGRSWLAKKFAFGAAGDGVEIWSHFDTGYRMRTFANAECDATMAAAADYSTGGERLTKTAAGPRYAMLPFYLDADEAGRRLAEFMGQRRAKSLNVAGNGIYTLRAKGMDQPQCDRWIFECIGLAHSIHPIARIQSGGQTGVDMAGAVAAHALGIPAKILMPPRFIQRLEDGIDRPQDPQALLDDIHQRSAWLRSARPSTFFPSP